MTAKYKKDTVSSTSTKSTATKTTNVSTEQNKIVKRDAGPPVSRQGFVTNAPQKRGRPTTLIGEEIYSEKDQDGQLTGKWDQQKQLEGLHPIEKFVRGIVSPYEQPVQMVKNIVEEVPVEKQMVQDTAIDLGINPVLETLAGAKDYGLTSRDFYWPDQLTGIDHPAVPAFLRTGGGSGSDIIGGLANNLGYIGDVVTNKDSGNIIGEKFGQSGERFLQQPEYYVGSAIGEIPLWFIGVGQAKAVATVTSKSVVQSVKIASATGKLPSAKVVKDIVKVEATHSKLTTNVEKSARSLLKNGQVSKGLDKSVKSAIKLVSKDLDIQKVKKIQKLGNEKDMLNKEKRLLDWEVKELRKKQSKTTSTADKLKNSEEMTDKYSKIRKIEVDIKSKDDMIELTTNNLDRVKLKKRFDGLSKDKSVEGKAKYLEAVNKELLPVVQTKFDELPNQVNTLKKIRKEYLEGKQKEIVSDANKINNYEKIDSYFWDATKGDPEQYISNISASKQKKMLKLRQRHINLTDDIDKTMESGYTPWGETLSKAVVFPSKVSSKWKNTWATRSTAYGDSGVEKQVKEYKGWSGELRKVIDYHAENISIMRSKETDYWSKYLTDTIPDIGVITGKGIEEARTNVIKFAKVKEVENVKLRKEIEELEGEKRTKKIVKEIETLESKYTENEKIINESVKYNEKTGDVTTFVLAETITPTLLTGAGKTKNTYFFEPEFLKEYMGENYKSILPKEITYVKRPISDLRKEGGVIKGTVGSEAIGNQSEVIIFRTPPKPPGKLKKAARRFKPPSPRIRNRYMTTANSDLVFLQRKYNPTGTDVVRVPKNAPDDVKQQLQRLYMKPMKSDSEGSKTLSGLTGGDNYELWEAIKYTKDDMKKIYSDEPINVGVPAAYATRDSDLYIPRTFDEIEESRMALRGDSFNVEQDILTQDYNIKIWEKRLEKLNRQRGTDAASNISDSPNIVDNTVEIKNLQDQLSSAFKKRDKLNEKLKRVEKQREVFADFGIGFGSNRGAVTIVKGSLFETQRKIGQRPILRNEDTGELYLFAQVNDQRKVYKIKDIQTFDKIKPSSEIEFATKVRDDVIGIDDSGAVERSTVQSGKTDKSGNYLDDDVFKYFDGSIGGRGAIESISEALKDTKGKNIDLKKTIRLGIDDKETLKAMGVEELTSKQVRELNTGPVFSGLIEKIDNQLDNIDLTPIVKEGDRGEQIASKSYSQQISEYIGVTGRKKISSVLSDTSKKITGAKRSLTLKGDKWSIVTSPSTSVSESSISASDKLMKEGIYELGVDDLSPFQKQFVSDKDKILMENPNVEGGIEASTYAPIYSSVGDPNVKGLNMYNVIDMAVIGGRNQDELLSDSVKRAVARRVNKRFKQTTEKPTKVEEMIFASEQLDYKREKTFKLQLIDAWKKVDETKKGITKPTGFTSKEAEDILKYNKDGKFEGSDRWNEIIKDINDKKMLREMTPKEKLLAYSKPGRKPKGKVIEQRAGVISPTHNFGDLHEYLPNQNLGTRMKDRVTVKLQRTDDFLSQTTEPDDLLSGFFSGFTRRFVTPKLAKGIQDDPQKVKGMIRAIEFAASKNVKIPKKWKRLYVEYHSRVDSRTEALKKIEEGQDEYGFTKDNVRGSMGTGSYAQAIVSEAEVKRLAEIDKKLNILEFGDDKLKESLQIKIRTRDEDGTLSLQNVMDKTVESDKRTTRLNQVKIELALEKTKIEKKFIDPGEYDSYKLHMEDLYYLRNTALDTDKIDANIRWIKERQGKPTDVSLGPEANFLDGNTDLPYTIVKDNVAKKTINNLDSSSVGDDILKEVQAEGYLGEIPGYENVKQWDKTKRAEAWDSLYNIGGKKGPISGNDLQRTVLNNSGFDVKTIPDKEFNSINKVTDSSGDVKYYFSLPFQRDTSSGIKTLDDWDRADIGLKKKIYEKAGYIVDNNTTIGSEFRVNRTQLPTNPSQRMKLITDPLAVDTLEALDKFRSDTKKGRITKVSKSRDDEIKRLNKLIKPPTKYDGKINVYASVADAKAKLNAKEMDIFEWQTADITNPKQTQSATSELRMHAYQIDVLKELGVDETAFRSVDEITRLLQKKEKSQSIIKTQLFKLDSSKKGSKSYNTAENIIKEQQSKISGLDQQLDEMKKATDTQSVKTTLRTSVQKGISSDPKVKFFSFGVDDFAPNYLGEATGNINLGPFIPGAFASTSPVLSTQTPQSQQRIDTSVTPKISSSEQIKSGTVQPQLDTTPGLGALSLSIPKMSLNLEASQTTRGILDSNLGWLAAQLPGQITRPETRIEEITSLKSVMRTGVQLKTTAMLRLEEQFKLKNRQNFDFVFRRRPLDFDYMNYRRRTQSITPIVFGPTPWELAEERARKRKKKPKRKSAKTWWQTPENWYESNYWGKSGTGSGYVTFKGSEPKRLKDRKNQFGF